MNKTEMLAALEARLGSRAAAVAALDGVLDEIQHAVASGEKVTLTGFGTFERVERPARIGRNPRTGTAVEIPAAATPRFRAGSVLRAAVAGPAPAPRARAAHSPSGMTALATPAPGATKSKSKAKKTKSSTADAPAKAPKKSSKAAGKPSTVAGSKKKKKTKKK